MIYYLSIPYVFLRFGNNEQTIFFCCLVQTIIENSPRYNSVMIQCPRRCFHLFFFSFYTSINYIDNISAMSWSIKFMNMSLKNWDKARFTDPFPSLVPNTHKLYILIHCINIIWYCIYPAEESHYFIDIYILNQIITLYNYLLISPFDIFCQQEVYSIYN